MVQDRGEGLDRARAGCVDVLAEAFGASTSDDVAVALVRAGGRWGFQLDTTRAALVAVTGGSCWLRRPRAQPVGLVAGDLALVLTTLPGQGLASAPDGELAAYDRLFTRLDRRGTGTIDLASTGPASSVVYMAYEPASPARRLLARLHGLIVVKAEAHAQRGVVEETLDLLSVELAHDHPGAQTAVNRLVDVLVVHLLRAWTATYQPSESAWSSGAPADAAITAALEHMHAEPARRWTVGSLAAEVGLSRAAFVRRFTALVGDPPSTYLTRWRLTLAARRLRDTTDPLAVVAREVGYSSQFTFSRAFHRAFGQPPGRYRARHAWARGERRLD